MCEAPQLYRRLNEEYQRLLRLTFDSALRYYRKERGTGSEAVEVTPPAPLAADGHAPPPTARQEG